MERTMSTFKETITLTNAADRSAALGLRLNSVITSTLADGASKEYAMTEGVEFRWKDREFALSAQLVPTAGAVLFGALAMESLDLMADPVDECLKGRRGDQAVHIVYQAAS
jgi:hypothetical protein